MRLLPLAFVIVLCTACSGAPQGDSAAGAAAPAVAAPTAPIELRIKNNVFIPSELEVPANVKFELLVINEDPTPEEFESHELNREKIVVGNGRITVPIGPLKPGRYPFFGEFHMKTAQGALIAK